MMVKLLLSIMALFLFCINVAAMFKSPTADKLTVADMANEQWKKIGKIYQFLAMPAQWMIFSITLALSYFSLISVTGVYFSIALLIIIFIVLMLFKRGIEAKLPSNNKGAEYVTKIIKQAMRASISLSVVVYLLCIGI